MQHHDIEVNGITLHAIEAGTGPAVVFCHGFPDTSFTWRRQMHAVAAAGYRAIAPDMRGYGRSAAHAWNTAMMRPDRFSAVFCLSVPYTPRGDVSVFARMRASGHQDDFYMFEQIRPEADQIWADAAVTIPGALYWASGAAPAGTGWSPLDPARSLHRPAPGPLPAWAAPDYVNHNIAEFQRTGFHGGLNYYRAAEDFFHLSAAFKGAKITQPSFFIWGKADGLRELYPLTLSQMRAGLPGLLGGLELDDVGHWVQHEAAAVVSEQLVQFLRSVTPV
jgi:pimeloyl-ACP methyl ester carboxylesterase